MRSFLPVVRRYLPPVGYGLITYGTVRLLNDTVSGTRFWERPWALTLFELGMSVALGFGLLDLCQRVLRHFDQSDAPGGGRDSGRQLLREVLAVVGLTELLANAVWLPLAALTDDGLSRGDAAAINTVPLLYVLIYYGGIRSRHFLRASLDRQLQLERAAREQALTELKFLRAQYHPHFLFNALNTVYFQMDEDVAAAKGSLEQISELLRYQLYDQQQPVRIAQEMQYLRSYLELQRVRSSEKLRLTVDLDPRLSAQRLYPLLLLPLLENAFKYVGGAYEIEVRATLSAAGLSFAVGNSVASGRPAARAGGIGLDNLRRRLALLYPGGHELRLTPAPAYFSAHLSLPLLPA